MIGILLTLVLGVTPEGCPTEADIAAKDADILTTKAEMDKAFSEMRRDQASAKRVNGAQESHYNALVARDQLVSRKLECERRLARDEAKRAQEASDKAAEEEAARIAAEERAREAAKFETFRTWETQKDKRDLVAQLLSAHLCQHQMILRGAEANLKDEKEIARISGASKPGVLYELGSTIAGERKVITAYQRELSARKLKAASCSNEKVEALRQCRYDNEETCAGDDERLQLLMDFAEYLRLDEGN